MDKILFGKYTVGDGLYIAGAVVIILIIISVVKKFFTTCIIHKFRRKHFIYPKIVRMLKIGLKI